MKLFWLVAVLLSVPVHAQALKTEVFDLLDLNRPGLEGVREAHASGKDTEAANLLLEYYRFRKGIATPEIPDPSRVKITAEQQKIADEALEHTFFVHYGFQPSFNYGKDINWEYWPVKDNELRWQLHRHKWFTPLGLAYRVSGDEKYATEWVYDYLDWIKKNPDDDSENAGFAWRSLEVSHRIQDQVLQFQLLVDAEAFTPAFLLEFLANYHHHADRLIHHYSEQGNHLLFQAQRMIYAGAFFPEFRDAATWRRSGISILNREIAVQVYPDGGHFELDPHYHLACIEIFVKALRMAESGGFREDFPQSFSDAVEKMIVFYANICYPDYSNPCFSDAKITTREEVMPDYRLWAKLFPDNQLIKYMATEGQDGALPDYLSKGFVNSGFFVFRNNWDKEATQMVVKAGPPGFWHCQPDNGTFEIWHKGKRLFQDTGFYVYSGDAERNAQRAWFRRTAVHNTLTLNGNNLETADSKTLLWKDEGHVQMLVTENNSYKGLTHRRTVYFVDESYFVLLDEAFGEATGTVNLNFQLPPKKEIADCFRMECFGSGNMTIKEEQGWVSTAYLEREERPHISYDIEKKGLSPVRYITVIVPKQSTDAPAKIGARFTRKGTIKVKVGNQKTVLHPYTYPYSTRPGTHGRET